MAADSGRRGAGRVQATVTVVSPLTILVDGATVACPAQIVDQYSTIAVGDRCYADDRAPRMPLITGGISWEA